MTKPLLVLLFGLSVLAASGQGLVNFNNDSSSLVFDNDGMPATLSDGLLAALYWAPLSNPNHFTQVGAAVNVGLVGVGFFNGGIRTTGVATAPGANARFQVRAWEGAYGSFETACQEMGGRAGKLGVSNILEMPTGRVPDISPTSLTANGLLSFNVAVCPEPSTWMLGALAAGMMLIGRRRLNRGKNQL